MKNCILLALLIFYSFGYAFAHSNSNLFIKETTKNFYESNNPNTDLKFTAPNELGVCPNPSNVALNKSATQSSTLSIGGITGSASKAVDGNTNGVFFTNPSSVSATNNEYQAWWEVDLGANYNIEQINIYNRTDGSDRTHDAYIMVSSTPFTSGNLNDALAQADFQQLITGLLGSPSTVNLASPGRYVRIQLNGSGYLVLGELEVMGCIIANTCDNHGGDADGDGVCADVDCDDTNPNIPTTPGTLCDDNNVNTVGDIIQSDGCTCMGTPIGETIMPANVHPKFVNELPRPQQIDASNGGTFYLKMEQSQQWLGLQSANGNPIMTNVWGYSYNHQKNYLGPTFNVQKDVPIDVKWINNLPFTHLLPIDESIHKAEPTSGIPTVVHLHGGHTESASDGFPDAWFTQNFAETGSAFVKQIYHYTNDQEATTLWYHDHTLGMTRLQNYAGLAGMYIIRDAHEASLNLPAGKYEREIVIQDKQFASDGSLYFPALLSDPEALDFPVNPNIEPTIFAEFFGDYILANGMLWPKMVVEPTMYRLRLLNASDSRFYIFKLSNGASFQQIGSDGGLLNHPVSLTEILLAPAERADIVIDFSGMAGQSIVLQNIGPDEPFKGIAANQAPADPSTTGVIMRFDVQANANASFSIPNNLRQPIQYLGQETNTRQLLLLESTDQYGRLKPSLGTAQLGLLGFTDPVTETPQVNDIEVWEIYNNTEDAHPIHIHQLEFQLINRQEFTGNLDPVTNQLTNIQLIGPPISPAPNEQGWKDTYIVPPGHLARVKLRFDIPGRFVWHCHILSHEDWDMMRPFEVLPEATSCTNPTNVALNKQATQSSTISAGGITGTASKAVDGNTAGAFFTNPPSISSVSATNYGYQEWWEVDLGANYDITQLKIWNRTDGNDNTSDFHILISNTPFTNSDLNTAINQSNYHFYDQGTVNSPSTYNANTSGRYVRLQRDGQGYMILAEVEVYGCLIGGNICDTHGGDSDNDGICDDQDCQPNDSFYPNVPGTPCDDNNPNTQNDVVTNDGCSCAGTPIGNGCTSTTNLALNQPANQSSTITVAGITGSASKAVDGNTAGAFFTNPPSASSVSATNYDYQAWWEIDLGADYNIEQLKIWNRTDGQNRTADFHIIISSTPFISGDLNTALTQASYSYYEQGVLGTPSIYSANTVGRYVRLQRNGQGHMILAEVEIYGCALSAAPRMATDLSFAIPDMIQFDAQKHGQSSELTWVTTQDVDVDYYQILVSTDKQNFQTVGKLSADQVQFARSYHLTDFQPVNGANYYRLKMVKLNGANYYTAVKRLDFDFENIFVYPNPTNDLLYVSLRNSISKHTVIEVFNSLGQLQYQHEYKALAVAPISLDVAKYVPGIYTITIKTDGKRRFSKQFVVVDK